MMFGIPATREPMSNSSCPDMNRALDTGITGQVGSHLAKLLLGSDREVLRADSRTGGVA